MNAESKIVPRKITGPMSSGVFAGVLLVTMTAGAGAMVFFFNPSTHGFYPTCMFHSLTGLNCPGCGMTRSLHALLHGEFGMALRDNALFVGVLSVLTLRGGLFGLNKIRGKQNQMFFPPQFLWLLLALALVFAVLRNLPAFAFLSP